MQDAQEMIEKDDEILSLMGLEDNLRRLLKREKTGSDMSRRIRARLDAVTALLNALDIEIADLRRRAVETELLQLNRRALERYSAGQPIHNGL